MKSFRLLLLSCWPARLALVYGPAAALDLADIQRMQTAGQSEQALQSTETLLAAKPKDPQLRFLRGVLLAERQRNGDALEVFRLLSEDFPELAEPYNNAAAVHAALGHYERAKVALEQAIRANPAFATAHENLGDVQAMLASQSYVRALQLEPRNAGVAAKLSVFRQLATPPVVAPSPAASAIAPSAR